MKKIAIDSKTKKEISDAIEALSKLSFDIADSKGFGGRINFGEKIALIHSELSEALEARRNGNATSEKIPPHSHVIEELADAIIRIAHLSVCLGGGLGSAVVEKMQYNLGRPYKHGKRF